MPTLPGEILDLPIAHVTVPSEVAFDADLCILCNQCRIVCPIGAVTFDGDDRILRDRCDSCGDCAQVCPSGALTQLGGQAIMTRPSAQNKWRSSSS